MRTDAEIGFTKEVIEFMRPGGSEISYSYGQVIIRQGEPGTAFYVILSGEVEVRLSGEEDRNLSLARLGEGECFGEMSLIRGEPASADIVALGDVRLLQYSAAAFRKALAESEKFRNALMERMAQNVHDTSTEAWSFYQRAEAFKMLAHKDIPISEPLVSKSDYMKKVEEAICRLAQEEGPVLITGEPGTGKIFVANKIHNLSLTSSRPSAPFFVIDCSRLDEVEACSLLFGSSQIGESTDATRLEGFGALHLAHGGTLVLQHIDALDAKSLDFLSCYLDLMDFSGGVVFPSARIIATTRESPDSLKKSGALGEDLLSQLSAKVLPLPSLRDRKEDILPLARIFLKKVESNNQSPLELSGSAEQVLLSTGYRHNNVRELREAVELAALFAEDGKILSEHLFSGPKDKGIPSEFDLEEIPFLRRIVHSKLALGLIRAGMSAVFLAIIFACLTWSGNSLGRKANSLIWGVWEPLLILSFLFIGHMWCVICPLSAVGSLVQRLVSLRRPTSQWIKKYGIWMSISGIFLILSSEKIFHMTSFPYASGILLLSLLGGAVWCGLLYQREVWCRYICPLGALASSYSFPATLHVRARPQVCASVCTTHECYKGTADTPGCPVFHHPLYISGGHNCKLCFKCLRICPHGSARLYFRPFLQSVWLFGGFAGVLAPFAMAVFSLSIAMLALHNTGWIEGPGATAGLALGAVILGILLNKGLARLLTAGSEPDNTIPSRAAFALMVLAWGPLMAYQLSNVPGLTALRFYAVPGSFLGNLVSSREGTLLVLLQVMVVLFAALLAGIAFWRIGSHAKREDLALNRKGWNMLFLLVFLYVGFALYLVLL